MLQSNKTDSTASPPQSQNNDAHNATLQQPQDPTSGDLPPLNIPELDLCAAFYSMKVYQTAKH